MTVRRIAFVFALLFTFLVPWEDSISTAGWGSLARVIGLVLAAFWLITISIEGRFRKPHLFHFLFLLFVLWNFLTVYWSVDTSSTVQRLSTYSQIFLFVLVFWEVFQKPGELKAGLQAYVFGGYVLVVGTIYNYVNGIVAVAYQGRYSAPGVNANDLALILILGLPIAMHLFLAAGHGKWNMVLKFMNLAYMPMAVFSVILTGTRTSLIAIIPFALYVAAVPQIRLQGRILIFVGLLVLLLASLPFIPESLLSRLSTFGSSVTEGDIGGRVALWREAIAILARHPILGIGSGTLLPTIGAVAHNTYVSVVTETGLMGFVLFLSTLAIAVYQAMRAPEKSAIFWIAVLMTWAIGVLSLSWEFKKVTWLVLGFMVIAGSLSGRPQSEPAVVPTPRETRLPLDLGESETKPKAA